MHHEVKIKRINGDTVTIRVNLVTFGLWQTDHAGNKYRYDVQTFLRKKGKRTDILTPGIATDAEILIAKTELWKNCKP